MTDEEALKEIFRQEVRGLKCIKDSFRKIVVVGDPQPMYTDDCGITYVGLMAFMLDDGEMLGRLASLYGLERASEIGKE